MTDMTLPSATDDAAGSGDVAAENLARLKALFPQIVRDGRIDVDVLRALVGEQVEAGEERYGLNWKGKAAARVHALTPSQGTLRPAKADSVEWDTTQNIMIEGDNLEVLKLLRRSYAGKVKLIYIDPPYNTGNDFVYPDDYSYSLRNYQQLTGQFSADGIALTTNKEASGRFHTDWLSMMYPRLMLARELLRDDGIISIFIDDAELTNLHKLMSEIFGEENFVGSLVFERNRKNDAKYFSIGHDYAVICFKSEIELKKLDTRFRGLKSGVEELKAFFDRLVGEYGDDWEEIRGELLAFYETIPAEDPREPLTRFRKVDAKGPFRDDGNINWPGGGGPTYEVLHPETRRPVKLPISGWRYPTPERFWEEVDKGRIVFGPDETTVPRVRTNIFENKDQVMGSVFFSYAQSSTNELTNLFEGRRVFDNPKSISDAKSFISYVTEPDDIVLDCFAGSGTTGHAVLAQNAVDGGNRRYILVQIPEPLDSSKSEQKVAVEFCDSIGKPRNIAELTKERLRRAGAKLKAERPGKDFDTGFRVYKLATSNLRPWQPDGDDLAGSLLDAVDNVLPGRSEDDLLVELMLKTGIDLAMPSETRTIAGQTVHGFGGGALMVCLGAVSDDKAEELALGIAAWRAELDPPGQTAFWFKDSGFASAAAKANVAAILRQRIAASDIARIAAL